MTKDEVMRRVQDILWDKQGALGEDHRDCEALRLAISAVDLHDDHLGIFELDNSRLEQDS